MFAGENVMSKKKEIPTVSQVKVFEVKVLQPEED